ncbi:hypothetical protein MHYP_G00003330 [Metynnis hypsauchen]
MAKREKGEEYRTFSAGMDRGIRLCGESRIGTSTNAILHLHGNILRGTAGRKHVRSYCAECKLVSSNSVFGPNKLPQVRTQDVLYSISSLLCQQAARGQGVPAQPQEQVLSCLGVQPGPGPAPEYQELGFIEEARACQPPVGWAGLSVVA